MTSKIKVDNINKVSDDSNIINKCGTTITLGASGDSIALASGATQSGFGRTGTVDWQTTPKTATLKAEQKKEESKKENLIKDEKVVLKTESKKEKK